MAGEQRRLAHAAKRDSTSMKTISLLGAIFLPATFLASVFSMTFFNFQEQNPPSGDSQQAQNEPVVSKDLWIYFVISVPVTILIVLLWWWWERRREQQYALEDKDIEAGIDKMEAQIMAAMRQRTMNKARTWGTDPRSPGAMRSPTWLSEGSKSLTD